MLRRDMSHESVAASLPSIDVRERGAERQGEPQYLDARLFMQLWVFDAPAAETATAGAQALIDALGRELDQAGVPAVLYADLSQPHGYALLSWSTQPADFVTRLRPVLQQPALSGVTPRPGWAMLGRTYSTGFEPDLEWWMLKRPVETVMNPAHPWVIWYPLRRHGSFGRLDGREQGSILREHAQIGRAYGEQDLAHDVRLACYGLDAADNDFVIGLVGKELQPLSHVVQAMRKTRQTAEFIAQMGPFFIGHARWRSAATAFRTDEFAPSA